VARHTAGEPAWARVVRTEEDAEAIPAQSAKNRLPRANNSPDVGVPSPAGEAATQRPPTTTAVHGGWLRFPGHAAPSVARLVKLALIRQLS